MFSSGAFRIFPHLLLSLLLFGLVGCAPQKLGGPSRPGTAAPAPTPVPIAAPPAGAPSVWPSDAPDILATSAILIDARNGRVLYQKNADEQRQVASTQKLLTGLLITQQGDLDGLITIAPTDTQVQPTKLGLRAGERYPRRMLLQAMMVRSSNDATAALARDHSGSEAVFVGNMNLAAWQLGARSSQFANAHGLPANQFSTARDIARIAFRAYRDPELRRMMLVRNMTFRFNSGRTTNLKATNDLLDKSPVFNGMKTGYTIAAGRCLVSSADFGDRQLILVQLGSRTSHIFNDAERLLRWGATK
jgi:D-alanyl-D-alanine carboxypeptidase (penicillin-binding protein 5/6)